MSWGVRCVRASTSQDGLDVRWLTMGAGEYEAPDREGAQAMCDALRREKCRANVAYYVEARR